ncbi:uncharacterized protein AMSG_10724 [Thecamonas trahens ATCC 50062]|uniref:Uncharacterized protein n=1 Tax=Thecamonas trahens ATCC 50062 TaxID=461836 RepID=A0A0L0DSD8_THETB|nr:hypothetical protein AMSG_10724 [Thecamonas trahens ATCC 50062]KNC55122.1 hypothetical protein AMSG_10724 [Thecamonas trahens ATCC 50062]|eukprot:XP_013753302.1 hypothetical protein AMSG_10724 [Thecamonas trahens ATCC 50062]
MLDGLTPHSPLLAALSLPLQAAKRFAQVLGAVAVAHALKLWLVYRRTAAGEQGPGDSRAPHSLPQPPTVRLTAATPPMSSEDEVTVVSFALPRHERVPRVPLPPSLPAPAPVTVLDRSVDRVRSFCLVLGAIATWLALRTIPVWLLFILSLAGVYYSEAIVRACARLQHPLPAPAPAAAPDAGSASAGRRRKIRKVRKRRARHSPSSHRHLKPSRLAPQRLPSLPSASASVSSPDSDSGAGSFASWSD